MDFSDALRAMKDGKKVTRAIWGSQGTWDNPYMMIMDLPAPLEPQLVFDYKNRDVPRPFSGAQWDLLADDWEIVDDA
jgi:hypothetical protein